MMLIEGALIALAGVLVGRFLPGLRKGPKPYKPPPEPQPICGCGHHFSFHSPASGVCKGTNRRTRYSSGLNMGQHDFPCGCQTYTGPQPLPEFFAQEIGGGS